jgi:hypothetical protein
VPAAAVFLFVPKCPFCLLGYLSLFGLGASTAAFALPALWTTGLLLGVVTLGSLAIWLREVLSRKPVAVSGCETPIQARKAPEFE